MVQAVAKGIVVRLKKVAKNLLKMSNIWGLCLLKIVQTQTMSSSNPGQVAFFGKHSLSQQTSKSLWQPASKLQVEFSIPLPWPIKTNEKINNFRSILNFLEFLTRLSVPFPWWRQLEMIVKLWRDTYKFLFPITNFEFVIGNRLEK